MFWFQSSNCLPIIPPDPHVSGICCGRRTRDDERTSGTRPYFSIRSAAAAFFWPRDGKTSIIFSSFTTPFFFFQCPVQARELSVPFSVKLPASKMAWPVPCPFYALTCSSNMGGNTAHLQLWSKLFQNREKAKNISVAGMIEVDTMAKIRSMLWKNIWCSLVAHFCTVTHYDF